MIRILVILIILIIGASTLALAHDINREAQAMAEVTRYVEDWSKNLPTRYRRRALRHVYSVAHWSIYYDIDPLLVAVLISLESSWNTRARGKLGEIGLMQVLARGARKGFNLSTGDGQIQAGVRWLRVCIDDCDGSIRRGVNNYATGSCTKNWRGLRYRMRLYSRAVKFFRNHRDGVER